MANEGDDAPPTPIAGSGSINEIQAGVEKYKARQQTLRILFGTMIVGLTGALISGIIQGLELYFDQRAQRFDQELNNVQARRDFLQNYVDHALAADLEVRIRFAEYFATIYDLNEQQRSDDANLENPWEEYLSHLEEERRVIRREIFDLQRERFSQMSLPEEQRDHYLLWEISQSIEWLLAQLGTAETVDIGSVPTQENQPHDSLESQPTDRQRVGDFFFSLVYDRRLNTAIDGLCELYCLENASEAHIASISRPDFIMGGFNGRITISLQPPRRIDVYYYVDRQCNLYDMEVLFESTNQHGPGLTESAIIQAIEEPLTNFFRRRGPSFGICIADEIGRVSISVDFA